jgi:hypothetical protein
VTNGNITEEIAERKMQQRFAFNGGHTMRNQYVFKTGQNKKRQSRGKLTINTLKAY